MLDPEADHDKRSPEPGPPAPEIPVAPVVRLRPIRTLVVSRDLAFRRRAMTVFVEFGYVAFAVLSLDAPGDVAALVELQRADVIVLDTTGCEPAAVTRVTVALCDAAPRVGVVLVADQVSQAPHAPAVLQKWGWAADLSQAVKDAYSHGNPFKEDLSDVRS